VKHYKRIVYAALGLTVTLAFGATNDFLFAPFEMPEGLPARFLSPDAYSFLFLFFYLCFALLIAEYLSSGILKNKIWAPLGVLFLSTLWCVLYFVFSLDDIGCGVLVVAFCLLLYVVSLAVKETPFAVLYGLPVAVFYAFLTGNALLLAVFSI